MKIFTILLILISPSAFIPTAFGKVKVVASISTLKSLVESVGKDLVEVSSVGKPTEDPHFVEVRPSFIMNVTDAKMYVMVGLSLDIWAKPLIESSRNNGIVIVNASLGIKPLDVPTERVTPLMGDVHPEGNPHYWVDPYNVPTIVKNIVSGLATVDPEHSKTYQLQAKTFLDELKVKTTEWDKRLAPFKGAKLVVYHASWNYFLNHFHFLQVAEVEPKPGIPPSGAHTQEVIQIATREKVKAILIEPYYSDAHPKLIAEKTGAKLLKMPQMVGGLPGTDTYIKLMEYNVTEIEKALK